MAVTQIHGGKQIQSGTITSAQLSPTAQITDAQLEAMYLYADGSRDLTGSLNGGGHVANNFGTPAVSTDLATKGYVDTALEGISSKYSAQCATTGAETYVISSGTVTSIGTATIDGVTPVVGQYLLVKNAPAASGAGVTAGTPEPANGLYEITAVTTTTTLARAGDMSAGSPAGAYVFVDQGAQGATGWIVTSPVAGAGFTMGTTAIGWTQFNASTSYTTDGTLALNGNELSRAAITGAVSIPTGSNVAALGSGVVEPANVAGIGASPTAGPVVAVNGTTFATEAQLAVGYGGTGLASAGASGNVLMSTGSGWASSSIPAPAAGSITFAMLATAAVVQSISASSTNLSIPTAEAVYNYVQAQQAAASQGTVQTVGVATANGFAGSSSASASNPVLTIETTVTGLLLGNGTGVSAAVKGSDYLAPSNYVVRAPLSGTPNGSTTSFTLPSTPISGTEMVFLNGVLQEAGTSADYQITGTTVAFNFAPDAGSTIYATYFTE